MQVVIQVSEDVARPLHQLGPPTPDSEALLKLMKTFGLTLKPIHPDTKDPKLQTYFIVEVQDPQTAQELVDRLQQWPGIEAAYIKPPDELP
jgi:cell division protein FtsX